MNGVLDGVRVLDFGRYIAGPFCAALLGDLGADVIRCERVDGGEDRFVQPVTPDGIGAMFMQCNRNKRCLTLNPTKPEGKEITRRLVETADVVVANMPPQTLKTVGLDYETLRRIKSDIILTTVTAFGRGGPWSDKVGFDGLAQSMSGNLHMSGTSDEPTRSFAPYVDYGTASLSAFSTMAALMHRDKTGEGQMLEGVLLKTALTFFNSPLIEQHHLNVNREATLNRSPLSGPADVFATKDGWVMCLVVGRAQFERWCEMVGAADLLADNRFATDIDRGDNGEVLSERMRGWCASRTNDEALAAMEAVKVPGGPVYTPQQALDDAHINALGFLKPMQYPSASEPSPISGYPVNMSATPGEIRSSAPQLGEHTDAILSELGYDANAIQGLRDARVV
ncbi:MAG: CoA transferase [Chromatiales bacterium]|jgi:crotonobetainyl-CoA:carnitine CoA-transferase CaiB-like acyl-CoA transferase|nr:CoA transferase [Chromatiales bacterium]